MGIHAPDKSSTEALRVEVIHAHTVQKIFEGINVALNAESQVCDIEEPWEMSVQLRNAGVTEDTLAKLLQGGIKYPHQAKFIDKETMVSNGVHPMQATIIANMFGKQESLIDLNKSINESDRFIKSGDHTARKRCLLAKWPSETGKHVPLHEYLEMMEYDMRLADPSKTEWIRLLRSSLRGDARRIAEKAIEEKPNIRYEELKDKLILDVTSGKEITEAFAKFNTTMFELGGDIVKHLNKVKEYCKIVDPDFTKNPRSAAMLLMTTIPHSIRMEIIKTITFDDYNAVEKQITSEVYSKQEQSKYQKEPKKPYQPRNPTPFRRNDNNNKYYDNKYKDKTKKQCSHCKKNGHNVDDCWFKKRDNQNPQKSSPQSSSSNTIAFVRANINDSVIDMENCLIKGSEDLGKICQLQETACSKNERLFPMTLIKERSSNLQFKTLLDTGACATLINEATAKRLNLSSYPVNIGFSGVNDSRIICPKIVALKLFSRNKIRLLAAYIIPGLNNELLFGANLIKYTDARIIGTGEENPFSIKQIDDNQDYVVEIERPKENEINMLFETFFAQEFDPDKIQLMGETPLMERLLQVYPDEPSLLAKIEEIKVRKDDFPQEILDLKKALKETINPQLSDNDQQKLLNILMKNQNAFSKSTYDLGCVPASVCNIQINIGNKPIPKLKPFRLNEVHRMELRKIVDELIENGIAEKSTIGGGAPAFIVPKPNGKFRMVVSYIELNKLIEKRVYPMPKTLSIC
uniref:Peptidase A2 domain-containing protein n=1 Tax=Tetranychus urticae TaxID=32264 RepID=A0A158P5P1_TETUR